jgi:ribonuclease HII
MTFIIGVDEAGRGPLAGDVYAAAVVLPDEHTIKGLADSKKLSAVRRESLAPQIQTHAMAWSVATASVAEIDELNILQATLVAMTRAVDAVVTQLIATGQITDEAELMTVRVQVDGNKLPRWRYVSEAIIGGDAIVPVISAASILAKTARDASMIALDTTYPEYGFLQHKGYGTAQHRHAILTHGITPAHRTLFVRKILQSVSQSTCD